jgi:cytoskeletal protein CcmA (bactofilin family)
MEQERRPDLKLNGVGSAGGGKYGTIEINGAGSVNGDVECAYMSINGTSEVRGNVQASEIKSNGAGKIEGNLASEEAEINGALSINGDITVERIKITGSLNAGGNMRAEEINSKGALKVKGDCEAETFRAAGAFNIGGLLNAENIYVDIVGNCSVKEIGGEKIEIRRSNNIAAQIQRFIKDIFNSRDALVTDSVEGDDIYLESTAAKVVRGNVIKIGPECEIDLVEYEDRIEVCGGSRVREQRKI